MYCEKSNYNPLELINFKSRDQVPLIGVIVLPSPSTTALHVDNDKYLIKRIQFSDMWYDIPLSRIITMENDE